MGTVLTRASPPAAGGSAYQRGTNRPCCGLVCIAGLARSSPPRLSRIGVSNCSAKFMAGDNHWASAASLAGRLGCPCDGDRCGGCPAVKSSRRSVARPDGTCSIPPHGSVFLAVAEASRRGDVKPCQTASAGQPQRAKGKQGRHSAQPPHDDAKQRGQERGGDDRREDQGERHAASAPAISPSASRASP